MSTACSTSASASSPAWLEEGGFLIVFYSVIAMFWAIVFVCEEYGVPSITAFCKRHQISDSLAGSIFIGTGLSLPVFFISIVGMFIDNAAIGIGAVVGGNLFNHLVTIGTSIYASPNQVMKLNPIIYTRECLIYLASCVLVIWAIEKKSMSHSLTNAFQRSEWSHCLSISWIRSLVLILVYIGYCIFDANFYLVEGHIERLLYGKSLEETLAECEDCQVSVKTTEQRNTLNAKNDINLMDVTVDLENPQPMPPTDSDNQESSDKEDQEKSEKDSEDKKMTIAVKSMLESAFDENEKYLEMFVPPANSIFMRALYYITLPLRYMIYWTTPDVRRPESKERINIAILMTIVWLAILCYILTVSLTVLGNWWRIDGAVMGFTIAAWASNFPAHWSSMVVSKHGFGDVSCCNCLGSNIFNNLIGLGLPWWIYSMTQNTSPYSALQDSGVVISVLLMIFNIFIQYFIIAASRWTLTMWMLPVMMSLYIACIAYLCYFSVVMNPSPISA